MEKKLSNMKNAVKFMSVLAKVGYIAAIVAFCVCATVLIALAVMGGETSTTIGESTKIIIADESVDVGVTIASCAVWIVLSAFLFAILFLTYRILNDIAQSGVLFNEKYVKTIRIIGILIAAMTVAGGVAEGIATLCMGIETLPVYSEIPAILIGAIVFCSSFVYDYACAKINNSDTPVDNQ